MEVFYVFLATQGSLIITIFRTRKKILPKLVYVLLLVHLVSKLMHIIPPPSLSLYGGCAVEPLKTDTPLDKQKCPSYRGVRLIEVLKSIDIRQKELKVQLIMVGQALINTNKTSTLSALFPPALMRRYFRSGVK